MSNKNFLVLYTVSGIKIKTKDINNISNELKEIKLPFEKERYYYPYAEPIAESIDVVEEQIEADVVE